MAALLVAMSVMAVLLSVALPTWNQMIRREREEELIFRGNQYARAINQYQRRFANASPATLDLLIEQKMLRKKFKDPLAPTKDGEFQMLYLNPPTAPTGSSPTRGGTPPTGTSPSRVGSPVPAPTGTTYGTKPIGGIVGVASKNTGQSIRVYKGKTRYNEWQFIGMEQSLQGGAQTGGQGGPPVRGGPPQGGGNRSTPGPMSPNRTGNPFGTNPRP